MIALEAIRVVRCTALEYPQVEAIRRAYFDARGQAVQRRGRDVAWYIALSGEKVAGCYSIADFEATLEAPATRVVLDLYAAPGSRLEVRQAVKVMWAALVADADAAGFDLVGTIDPANEAFLDQVFRKGFEPIGVVVRRPCLRR